MQKVKLFNIFIDNIFTKEVLEPLKKGIVFTLNVDQFAKLQNAQDFFKASSSVQYKVYDRQILIYADLFLVTPLKEKIKVWF